MRIKLKIFCFTYAGGNASFFNSIESDLPDFEFVKMEYSGHGTRHKEPFYNNFNELADDMYSIIKNTYDGCTYSLFGYSMGSIGVVEVLRRIINGNYLPLPVYVFLAAHEPKTKVELEGFTSDEQDEWVKVRTIRFGGIPEKLIYNKSFWRMYLPVYRADYSIIGKYRFEDLCLSSDIPTTVFYSEKDTRLIDMKQWEKCFSGGIDYHQYDGTHFFIQNHHKEMADIIRTNIYGRINNDI